MSKIPKPWEHKISIGIGTMAGAIQEGGEVLEVTCLVATCTCGRFRHKFPNQADMEVVNGHVHDHMDTHPEPPLSIAEVGGGNIVMVMLVPGPTDDHAHMTLSVPRAVFDDGEKLGEYMGLIGSQSHFIADRNRRRIHEHAGNSGFRFLEVDARSIMDLFERMREGTDDPGVAMFDVPKPEQTGPNPPDDEGWLPEHPGKESMS